MAEPIAGFDWDAGNRAKCQKHGVSLGEIEHLFDAPVLVIPDPTHSQSETRMRAIGKTPAGRTVFWYSRSGIAVASDGFARLRPAICTPRKLHTMKKKIPHFKSDAAAERFVGNSDLTQYDLSGVKPVQFEFEKKGAQLNMRLPKPLLDAVKLQARKRGIPYTRLVREALERAIAPTRRADGQ